MAASPPLNRYPAASTSSHYPQAGSSKPSAEETRKNPQAMPSYPSYLQSQQQQASQQHGDERSNTSTSTNSRGYAIMSSTPRTSMSQSGNSGPTRSDQQSGISSLSKSTNTSTFPPMTIPNKTQPSPSLNPAFGSWMSRGGPVQQQQQQQQHQAPASTSQQHTPSVASSINGPSKPQQTQQHQQQQANGGHRPGYFVNDPQRESEPARNASQQLQSRLQGMHDQSGDARYGSGNAHKRKRSDDLTAEAASKGPNGPGSVHHHHHHHSHRAYPNPNAAQPQSAVGSSFKDVKAPSHAVQTQHQHAPTPPPLQSSKSSHFHHIHHLPHPSPPASFPPGSASGQPQSIQTEDPSAAAAKSPAHVGPLYTLEQAKQVTVNPPNLLIRSTAVLKKLQDLSTPATHHLGNFKWDPASANLLDGDLLRNNIGGRLNVFVDARWFVGVKWTVRDPALPVAASSTPIAAKTKTESMDIDIVADTAEKGKEATTETPEGEEQRKVRSWTIYDTPPFEKRKVWGSEVYTDDSDPVAMACHSGWLDLEISSPPPETSSETIEESKWLEIGLRVAPKLIRYQGCLKGGIQSRSWGNGHDGVSLMVEHVEVQDVCSSCPYLL
jgi:hypothetical protein